MKIWAILPAAGIGQRMAASIPKQYLLLNKLAVIEHSLAVLAQLPLEATVVALNPNDTHWQKLTLPAGIPNLMTVVGGDQRSDSVLNGLQSIAAAPDDLVLVHDSVRPCVKLSDINHLIQEVVVDNECKGGILAAPLSDTIKRVSGENEVTATVAREGLWSALTPQLFRYGELRIALETAIKDNLKITDEASAMERRGHIVKVVQGSSRNIKITHPDDLTLAEMILKSQEDD